MRRPFLFAVLLILSVLLVEVLAGFLAVVLFGVVQTDAAFAPLVLLITTLYLVLVLWAFKWLKVAGVGSLGNWKGWAAALILLVYYLFALIYAFFGEFSFTVPTEAVSGLEIPALFLNVALEEFLFRGLILYTLMSAWGATRKGVLKAVIVTAFLFGLIHGLNAVTGDASEVPGQIAIALFESLWWGAIVLRWGSVWPVVLIHAATNWVLQTKALSLPGYHGTAGAYALAVLLGLPLAALGLWWISRDWQGLTRVN
jgi:membrane protease YdiL (CAAX protease family)